MDKYQIEAFWSKVDIKDNIKECWDWKGARSYKGYGKVRINKKYIGTHRVAFTLSNGPIPELFLVCHICDNPICCNPSHLMLGTAKSNAADMLIKNRQASPIYAARGVTNGNSKLTEEKVIEIRSLYAANKLDQYQLADRFGVTQSCIGYITRNKTWRHV